MHPSRFMLAKEDIVEHDVEKGLLLARRVHSKYGLVFDKLRKADRAAVALYFLPKTSEEVVLEVILLNSLARRKLARFLTWTRPRAKRMMCMRSSLDSIREALRQVEAGRKPKIGKSRSC